MGRISSYDGCNIEYPNRLAYAGMPAIVKISNGGEYIGAGLTIKVNDDYYTEVRTLYNGETTFDISRYMQLAFEGKPFEFDFGTREQVQKSNLAQDVSVVVQITEENGTSVTALQFDVKALFGYIAYGQSNGGVRYRKLFANYPQTFDFYLDLGTELSITANGKETLIQLPLEIKDLEQVSIELSRWWAVPGDAKTAELYADDTSYLNGGDVVEGEGEYRLTIDRSKSGVFLRWLDHFGQWCYYLLRPTGSNYTTKEVRTWQNSELRDSVAPTNGVVQSGDHLQQQLSQQQTITLGAKLVDAEIFDFLLSLIASSRVEMLVNAEEYHKDNSTQPIWERVNVVAGSYARTGAPLQDFIISIAKTANQSQIL